LGRWDHDGLLEYIGRKDEQIKLDGRRIHPSEIERALTAFPDVADAAIVVRKDASGVPRTLAAYVTLRPDVKGLLPRHLAAIVQQRLPSHMVPWPIFIISDFPRLPSLKIDRFALAQADAERISEASRPVEDPIIAAVVEVFEQVIGIAGASADDSIASLGGDSLQSVDIAAELERRFGVVVSDETMVAAHTIGELALWIAGQKRRLDGANQGIDAPERHSRHPLPSQFPLAE
jgi:acyl carrier protein